MHGGECRPDGFGLVRTGKDSRRLPTETMADGENDMEGEGEARPDVSGGGVAIFEPRQQCMVELVRLLDPYLHERTWPRDHVLWNEGDGNGRLLVIESGRVKIVRVNPVGKSILLFVFGPGDVFGFLPFIDGEPYPATAVTMDDVRARVMSRARLREALRDDPDLGLRLLAVLGVRLRDAMARVEELTGGDALTRTAAVLVSLLPAGGGRTRMEIVHVPSPAYLLASQIGLTPETFSRALGRLRRAGVLHRLGSGRYQVLDPVRLRNAAAGRWNDN